MVARLGDKVVSVHSHINIEAMGGSRGCLQHMPPQLAVFWLEVIDAGQVEAGTIKTWIWLLFSSGAMVLGSGSK